jgi:uncharacterized protein (DUF1015 family)
MISSLASQHQPLRYWKTTDGR